MKKKTINGKNNDSNRIKPKELLIHLINKLNTAIRNYYNSTKQIINTCKKEKFITNDEMINIEKLLFDFINRSKNLFSRMAKARRQSLLEENNNNKIRGQLYNYCNNNFFYYSNGPTNVKTNPNYFTKIVNHGLHQKMGYKSPTNKFNNISNNDTINHINNMTSKNSTQNSYSKFNKETNIFFPNENSISKEFNKKIVVPKLIFVKNINLNKDDLMKNILNLLKQLNQSHGKIFYETEEAFIYKNIFNKICENLNKLISILSKEKIESNQKCLTEYKQRHSKNQSDMLINLKQNSHINLEKKFNKSSNNINSRNNFKQDNYYFSIENPRAKNEISLEKKIQAMTENSTSRREIKDIPINKQEKMKYIRGVLIQEGINEYNKRNQIESNFLDKEQQTDKIILEKEISKEININIEADSKYIMQKVEKEKLILDLENKIKMLNDNIKNYEENISKLKKENDSFKNNLGTKVKSIESLNKEINLLKQYIDKKENKEKEKNEINNSNKNIIINSNNNDANSKNESNIKEQLETDLDKISIKYELLKLDYDRQKLDLEEKEKLLNNYNIYKDLNESKITEEKINKIMKEHEKEIEELNKKYTKNILELKLNLPNCFSPSTHEILIDKKFQAYDLHWYLLTITSAKDKDYENTFWVSEDEIKSSLNEFKTFKTEEDIERENINVYILAQQKLISRIENNENLINNLKNQIQKLKGEK